MIENVITNVTARTTEVAGGWQVHLSDLEVEAFKKAHYKIEGYNQIVTGIQGNNPTDEIIIKLGQASAEMKDLGMDTAAAAIPELTQNPNMLFTWDCDFASKVLNVKLV